MPHTTDQRISKELARLLYLGRLQTKCSRPTLDPTDRGQLAFQALLFECLMSTREHPHPLEQPRRSAMASISGYLNVVCHQPGHLEMHTNTACRVASRILPFLHEDHGVCGIPGLRLIDFNCRRVRLIHLPTGGRLDLVDAHRWRGMDIARMIFRQETSWHQEEGRSPLWRHEVLTDEEAAHCECWGYTASTPLRSALLMRSMPLWYRFDLSPAWVTGHPTRPHRLVWDARSDTEHDQVVELLTRSAARIPGAVYHEKTPCSGTLQLGSGSAQLISNC
ncbi:hypothetical protein ADK52_29285 [Streptomyces sp. WM6372]|uniref:hypothetical protein n=1 Tax=Streptomyces sp. WM6372 TaxID=1415555 RepID=UPI0006AE0C13|nr:hypothetical protein [Streptomyces sp. WM6372]KOU19138.1 hypothetical protein ADK52_29285 [Streptomyces sp. WM6372]